VSTVTTMQMHAHAAVGHWN